MAAVAKLVALLTGGLLGALVGLRGALLAAGVAALLPTALLLGARHFRDRARRPGIA